jgi:hypothetical protein
VSRLVDIITDYFSNAASGLGVLVCANAFDFDNRSSRFVLKCDEPVCAIALDSDGRSCRFVLKYDEPVCAIALDSDGRSCRFVLKYDELVCAIALDSDGRSCRFVLKYGEQVCANALDSDGRSCRFLLKDRRGFGLVIRAAGWHDGDPGSILGRDSLYTFGCTFRRQEL